MQHSDRATTTRIDPLCTRPLAARRAGTEHNLSQKLAIPSPPEQAAASRPPLGFLGDERAQTHVCCFPPKGKWALWHPSRAATTALHTNIAQRAVSYVRLLIYKQQ